MEYRIWDNYNRCWDYGESIYANCDGEIFEIEERSYAYQTFMYKAEVSDRYKVCWFTGLANRSGEKIYEGSIVKGHYHLNGEKKRIIGQVVFSAPSFCINGIGKYSGINHIELDSSYGVIGHVFSGEVNT